MLCSIVQVVLQDENGLALTSDQQVSVAPVGQDVPLAGNIHVTYSGTTNGNGLAIFTDLAFMTDLVKAKLRFTCDSCEDSGKAKLTIFADSATFDITAAFDELLFTWPKPSVASFIHTNVAGEVCSSPFLFVSLQYPTPPVLSYTHNRIVSDFSRHICPAPQLN